MRIHTIGHSNHRWAEFLELLQGRGITHVLDVRSRARSRFPQFTQPRFAASLAEAGIAYTHMGASLGGKPEDPQLYAKGTPGKDFPDFDRVRATALYKGGVKTLLEMLKTSPDGELCLLCAEEDPEHCHRTLLIGPDLDARGVQRVDIRKPGKGKT